MEKPVKFLNKENQHLFGIIHVPENNSNLNKKEGVILVHSGGAGRIGYGCQHVHYARQLCSEGFYVLRFDPHGMGDSEGVIPNCSWSSFWSNIQTGLYIDDVMVAIDFFVREENIKNITLMGLCSGALSALLSTEEDNRVDALILLEMPVLLDDPSIDYQGKIPVSIYRSHLIKKILSFESWKKFLTLKTNYRHILRLAYTWIKKEIKRSKSTDDNRKLLNPDRPDFNKYVLSSFMSFVNRKKRVLFIYGTNGRSLKEFQDEFQTKYLSPNDKYNSFYDVYTIERANHQLTQRKWQDDAIKKSIEWLKNRE